MPLAAGLERTDRRTDADDADGDTSVEQRLERIHPSVRPSVSQSRFSERPASFAAARGTTDRGAFLGKIATDDAT